MPNNAHGLTLNRTTVLHATQYTIYCGWRCDINACNAPKHSASLMLSCCHINKQLNNCLFPRGFIVYFAFLVHNFLTTNATNQCSKDADICLVIIKNEAQSSLLRLRLRARWSGQKIPKPSLIMT